MTTSEKRHWPDGPWYQPEGDYAGYCRCGAAFSGRSGGEAEDAWLRHYEAVRDADHPKRRSHSRA